MKKEELRNCLKDKKIPEYYYNLDIAGEIDQRVCLEFNGKGWIVYYSERGKKFDLTKYETEDEACDDVYNRLVK